MKILLLPESLLEQEKVAEVMAGVVGLSKVQLKRYVRPEAFLT
jgi:hypothetical protein